MPQKLVKCQCLAGYPNTVPSAIDSIQLTQLPRSVLLLATNNATQADMYEPPKPSDSTVPGDKTKANSRQISFIAISDLVPALHNARKHSRAQIRAIARSIQAFGFNAPILVDGAQIERWAVP
jgi:ParB-like nuclease domain